MNPEAQPMSELESLRRDTAAVQAAVVAEATPLVRAGVDVVTAVQEALRRVAPGPSPYQAHVLAIEDAVMAATSGRTRSSASSPMSELELLRHDTAAVRARVVVDATPARHTPLTVDVAAMQACLLRLAEERAIPRSPWVD